MRIVTDRCRTYQYTVTTPAPGAIDLDPSTIGARHVFFDCLLVTVCVDPGDPPLTGMAARIVHRIVYDTDAAMVVVNGFARPPARAEQTRLSADFDVLIADALDVLTELTERLEERGERAHLMPFGWNKSCRIETLEGPGAQDILHLTRRGISPSPPFSNLAGPLVRPGWRTSCTRPA
jgi:hypothetical protein